jgi:carbonic anhydrase/acetyltransferase-like protein (isoleucine patch superfamily)
MIIETENGKPSISPTAFISDSAVIVGNVIIGEEVLVAPNATIRADEPGSRVVIGSGCNVQDNSVVHALTGSTAEVHVNSTLGHSCIIHGPCLIGRGCFIGFGSIIFASELGDRCFVLHRALVHEVTVPMGRIIRNGQVVDDQKNVGILEQVPEHHSDFALKAAGINRHLAREYLQREQTYPREMIFSQR